MHLDTDTAPIAGQPSFALTKPWAKGQHRSHKAHTAARALQVLHDQHAANLKSPVSLAERHAIHRNRQATKSALRADPAAIAADLDALNVPILQRSRLANIQPSPSTWPRKTDPRQPNA